MLTAPHAERVEFYKFKYAVSMFAEARSVLSYIKEHQVDSSHPLHHSLWTAFYVFYSKPFKQRTAIKLDTIIVPDEHRDDHKAIITLRDKMFAHSDLDDLASDSGEPLNAIIVSFHGGPPTFGFRFLHPRGDQVDRFGELVDKLIQKASFHAAKPWNRWARKLKVARGGQYRFNTSKESGALLKPLK